MPRTISDSSILSNCYGHQKASQTFVTPKVDMVKLKKDKTYRPPPLNPELAHFGERIDKEDFTILSNIPTPETEARRTQAVRVGVGLTRSDPNAPPPPPLLDLDFSEKQEEGDDFVGSFNKLAQGIDDDFIEESIAFYDNFGERRPDKLNFRTDDEEVIQESLQTEREDRIMRGDEDLEVAISQSQFQPNIQTQITEQAQGGVQDLVSQAVSNADLVSEIERRTTQSLRGLQREPRSLSYTGDQPPEAPSQLMTRETLSPEQEREPDQSVTEKLKSDDDPEEKSAEEPLPKQAKKKAGRPRTLEPKGFQRREDKAKRQERQKDRRERGIEDDDEFTDPDMATGNPAFFMGELGLQQRPVRIPINPDTDEKTLQARREKKEIKERRAKFQQRKSELRN